MERIDELLRYVVSVLEEREIPYAVAGSIGMMAYGEVRGTMDLDVVVRLTAADVGPLLARFPFPDFYSDASAAREAIRSGGTFNVLHDLMKVDLFPASDEVERNQVARARRLPTLGTEAMVSPPEELIVKKLEYYDSGRSDKHLRDIAAMLRVSSDSIDRERIGRYARRLQLAELWEMVMQSWDREGREG
jgi:hypothetical protein